MLNKINWGWRIAMLYGGFALFILFLVWKTTTVTDDLVTPDYYAKELQYQEQIDKVKRTSELKVQPTWRVASERVEIIFPSEMIQNDLTAQVLFYSPAKAKNDVSVNCVFDPNGLCSIDASQLNKGVYQMKIDWSAGGLSYYNEGTINVH